MESQLAPEPTASVTEDELVAEIAAKRREFADNEPRTIRFPAIEAASPEAIAAAEARYAAAEADAKRRDEGERTKALMDGAGDRYRNCRLSNFRVEHPAQKPVVEALTTYCQTVTERAKAAEGVVLYGPVGTGKDHLAFAVARAAVLAGFSVRWLNGQDWFGQIRDAMDDDTSEASLVKRISLSDFAVISDPLPPIGNLTQHQATMLYRAIEARYRAGKPTIVTVNVIDDDNADTRLGTPTWDRLCHGTWKVQCAWPSYRKPAREIK